MSCKYKYRDFFIDVDKCIIKKNGETVHMDFKQTWTILDCLLRAKVSGNGSVDLSALCISDTSKMLGRIKRVFGEDFYGRGLTGNIYINDPVTKVEAFPEELPFQTHPTNANSVPNFQKDNKKTSLQLLNPASIRLLPNTEKCFEQSLISANDQHVFFTISQDSNIAEIKNYIKNNRQTLLCQGGGCGKTVFLKRIEKELYKSNANEFVYYLSLGSLSHKQLTHLQEKYREYVYDRFDYESSIIISSIIQKYLDGKSECFEVFKTFGNSEHNPVLLLLDGLNEVPSSIYSQIVYEITQLQNLNFYIILSSRNTDVPLELQNFKKAYLSKVPEQFKSTLINKMDSKKQFVSPFVKQIINIPFYYGLIEDMLSKKTTVPKNEYDILELCYMEYSFEHIKRLVNTGEEFEILCGVYYCIIPLLAYDMLKPNAVYSISKAELEEKIDFIVSEKELCSVVLRTYMPKHFSNTIEIHKNDTEKYLNCLVNQSLLSCENNIYSFKHQNWADYHAASVVVSIIKAYQQNLVTSTEAAEDLLCLNLPNSVLHYVGEVFDLNEDTKVSDNAVASLKNIFSGLKKLENIQDIKPEHVYYASILNLFLEFKRNVSVNDKTSPVIEEIVDRVISPLYLKFKRDITSCAYLQEALDNNPYFTEAVRIKLASLIFQKIQIYSVKSASSPLQEVTTRAREYVAFANSVYQLDSVANMDARIDFRTAEDEILQYNRPHNAKTLKELCSVVLRTYMPKHFSNTIEIHKNDTEKYLNCLVNQSLLSCENNIYSFKHQNWADYHAASVVVSIIKAYQQNLVTSTEAAEDLLCLNLPNSVLHYVGEVFDLNEDTKVSDNAVASLKNIFSGLKKLENIQDIKPEHVYYASILNLFLEFKRNVSVNDKTSPVIEEIVDRVISPLYLKFKRDITSCAYLQEALDNNPYFTEAVRIKLASLIFQKIQIYSVKSASSPLQEVTTRAREYVAFANSVYQLDSVANMDARIDFRTAEDEILQYNRPHNAKTFFDTGYRKLEKLALNRVTASCNLLALICSFPSPYLVRSSVVNRASYRKAFTLYASAIVGKENKGDIVLYSIRNMIALLLRGYVQVDNPSLDFYDLTDSNMLRIGSCNGNNIYDFVPCNNESLLLAKKLYNMTVGYYRPLMYFYGACIDVMQKDSDSALEKLKAEIELSSKLSAQFTLQPKILYNYLTNSDTYDVSRDYCQLKTKLLDKNSQKFWHFDSLYYYLDVKRLELSINAERRDFFRKFESKLDFDSLENIRKCKNLIAESMNKTH